MKENRPETSAEYFRRERIESIKGWILTLGCCSFPVICILVAMNTQGS